MEMMEVRAIVQDAAVRFPVAGTGEPVILIHGLAGSSRWWSPMLPLASRHRLLMPDLPGFGRLRYLGRGFTLDRTAEWLLDLMDATGLERAHIVGHSMGANLALRLALEHPSRVDRLALVAPAGIVPTRRPLGHVGLFVKAGRLASPAFLRVLARDTLRAHPQALVRAARQLWREDLRGELYRVGCPTLVICGERDSLVPVAVGRLAARTLPDAQLLVLPGAGHVPMFEASTLVNSALGAFFAGQPIAVPGTISERSHRHGTARNETRGVAATDWNAA